ncbi:MAG: polyribonucleotide nucleotidyltransferase, partial [Elusimicrobiota bacterium]
MKKEILIGKEKVVIETGELAKQADGSVVISMGGTSVLVTVTASREPLEKEKRKMMVPLTVDYRERTYAVGKIPGGFFKREGRPREREILNSRLIDRTIRPLFDKRFQHEIQVNALVLSSDAENDSDVISVTGASCALILSTIPFPMPVACVRVGKIANDFIINPNYEEQSESELDMVLSASADSVLMIEMGAKEVSEEIVISAIEFAKKPISDLCKLQIDLQESARKEKKKVNLQEINPEISGTVESVFKERFLSAALVKEKLQRENAFDEMFGQIKETLLPKFPESEYEIMYVFEKVFRQEMRNYVLSNKKRIDGRQMDEIRPLSMQIGVFPRLHGSAIFSRGQTQALATVTLGTPQDMQVMEELEGEYKERFLFHYNFPGFATGEVKPDRSPSRREVGHGALAKRSLTPVFPSDEEFPYTVRIVSDILESNGSSSMASVCGGSLALFDAGVPIKSAVAGIAMGLIKNGGDSIILTDIIGLEDNIGDMDCKVAGTESGITGMQMDLKISGIEIGLISKILERAKESRKFVLEKMESVIEKPRQTLSQFAPRMVILVVPQSKIGALIGPGGKNIRQITEQTNSKIDIEEDGRVFISGTDPHGVELATQMVEYYTAEVEVGKTYKGKVTRIMEFGAFVEILPGKEGLVHISQMA